MCHCIDDILCTPGQFSGAATQWYQVSPEQTVTEPASDIGQISGWRPLVHCPLHLPLLPLQQAVEEEPTMHLQLIRNATLKLRYADEVILIDPDFAAPLSRPSFTGRSANPMVGLPLPTAAIATNLSLLIVSHLHRDHFDAVEPLPKNLPIICQPGNEAAVAERGFAQVLPVERTLRWNRLTITRVDGQHGVGAVGALMGRVSGFVFAAAGEPTLYWAGDTILGSDVEETVVRFQPEVIVVHACGATWPDDAGKCQLIVMDAAQTVALCQAAPRSTIIATLMDALDHATLTRAGLRAAADAGGITRAQLIIPRDGAEVELLPSAP